MLLVGGGDELGGFDDSQFQDTEVSQKKKSNNIVRKSKNTPITILCQTCTSSKELRGSV